MLTTRTENREELLMLIDAANRVGHRKDEIYEIDFAQIELVSLRKRKPRDPVDAEPSRRLIKPKRDLQKEYGA